MNSRTIEKICHGITTIPAKTDSAASKIKYNTKRKIEVEMKKAGNRE